MPKQNLKYIFVVGGVMSGVGKGIASASIGKILQARGFEVTALKIDPYVNVDAGTMNPTEHGEVFVLDDGMECDQDMGNYERFLDRDLTRANYMTTGSIYLEVIRRERNLEYGGKSVSVVPYIPLEVIARINRAAKLATRISSSSKSAAPSASTRTFYSSKRSASSGLRSRMMFYWRSFPRSRPSAQAGPNLKQNRRSTPSAT